MRGDLLKVRKAVCAHSCSIRMSCVCTGMYVCVCTYLWHLYPVLGLRLLPNQFTTYFLFQASTIVWFTFDVHVFICTCTTPHQCGLRNKQYCSCFSRHSTILTSSHLRQDQIDPVVAVDTIVHMDLCLQWAVALIVGGLDSPAMDPIVLTSLLEI